MLDTAAALRYATVYDIQTLSTDAGPGVRTVVSFKGCPAACRWCEHPEGISYRPELALFPSRCIQCGDCVAACPQGALRLEAGALEITRRHCQVCGLCLPACPAGALSIIGRAYTLPALLEQIKQDSLFCTRADGGVTFSGGEAASQRSFLHGLASACKDEHIHTALDTCLIHEWAMYRELLPHIDLWRVKLSHLEKRAPGNGQGIQNTLDNLKLLNSAHAHVWIRTTIVPGWSDDEADVCAIAGFISRLWPAVERWELQSFAPPTCHSYQGQLFQQFAAPDAPPYILDQLASAARRICDQRIAVIASDPIASVN